MLLHDNAKPYVVQSVKDKLKDFKWEVLPHPPYVSDVALLDYNLFRKPMKHGLSDLSFQELKKWLDEWIVTNFNYVCKRFLSFK